MLEKGNYCGLDPFSSELYCVYGGQAHAGISGINGINASHECKPVSTHQDLSCDPRANS